MILLDESLSRRATISHYLSGHGLHVEPFESITELVRHIPNEGLVLVHDHRDAVATLAATMVASGKWLPIVAFDEEAHPDRIVDAILNGAIDYMLWPFDDAKVCDAFDKALSRSRGFAASKLRKASARKLLGRLTKRELQVLTSVAAGRSNRIIAQSLKISPRTVEIHRTNMVHKLGVSSSSQAIRLAFEAELEDEPPAIEAH